MDQLDQQVLRVLWAPQVHLVNRAVLDQEVAQVQMGSRAVLDHRVRLVQVEIQVPLDRLGQMDSRETPVLVVQKVFLEHLETQALLDLQDQMPCLVKEEIQVLQALQVSIRTL